MRQWQKRGRVKLEMISRSQRLVFPVASGLNRRGERALDTGQRGGLTQLETSKLCW